MADKYGFSHHLWIADENGNIYFIKRSEDDPDRLEGVKVSDADDKFDFESTNELIDRSLFSADPGKQDRSVAVVKMMLAMGVASAAIPQGIIDPGDGMTIKGTSYVVNLASFSKDHAFWPDDTTADRIDLKPHPGGAKQA